MAELWKGAPVAAALTERLIPRAQALAEKGVTPTLAIVRVGERPEDLSYERGALKRCEKVGIAVRQYLLTSEATQTDLMEVIEDINRDDSIHGCLMSRPLPKHMDEAAACAALSPAKDVDGITAGSLAAVFSGSGAGYPPCTAQACLEVLVAAAGKAGAVSAQCLAPGQVVLDVGINVDENGNLVGDVDFAAAETTVDAITPVPGGVGAVTTSVLARHVIEAAEKAIG